MNICNPPEDEPVIPDTVLAAANIDIIGGRSRPSTVSVKSANPPVCATTPPKPITALVAISGMIESCVPSPSRRMGARRAAGNSTSAIRLARTSAKLGQITGCALAKAMMALSLSAPPSRRGARIVAITSASGKMASGQGGMSRAISSRSGMTSRGPASNPSPFARALTRSRSR